MRKVSRRDLGKLFGGSKPEKVTWKGSNVVVGTPLPGRTPFQRNCILLRISLSLKLEKCMIKVKNRKNVESGLYPQSSNLGKARN